jgi:hypothetical protein
MVDELIDAALDVTPNKKILTSISKDIDLYKGICEMIDNSIDNWILKQKEKNPLYISIYLNEGRNEIVYEDDSGGIKEDILPLVIQPGATERTLEEETIGVFGVGAKRALIALSKYSETVSRYPGNNTFKIILDNKWLTKKEWKIAKYKTSSIEEGHTKFILKNLKFSISRQIITEITDLISETYYYYLKERNVTVELNGAKLTPNIFNNWSYPPEGRHPREYKFNIKLGEDIIRCSMTIGLMLESSQTGKYGFDLFCNDRRILYEVNDHRLGFRKGSNALGTPHSTIAWFRGIIRLKGKNKNMPWNSSKSDIDPFHPAYIALYKWIILLAKPYVQLSRRIYSESDKLIKPFKNGKIEIVKLKDMKSAEVNKPILPPGQLSYEKKAKKENIKELKDKPWTRALLENIIATDIVLKSNLEYKNRYALILLDSCLEIAFKEYILRVKKFNLPLKADFRKNLHKMVKKHSSFNKILWDKIDTYYDLRCKLYHEEAATSLTKTEIVDFREEVVCKILRDLHNLSFDFSEGADFLSDNE